jgi:hypothetical protein
MRMLQRLSQIPAASTLVAGILVSAQAQDPLSLDQLLSQVPVNTERYSATVPSFICNEHILSQEVHEGKIKRETTVDAVFSVTRPAAKANTLEESREIKLIDGKPAATKVMTLPLSFSDHRSCFEYAADASTKLPKGTAAFTFVAKPAAAEDTSCASIQPGTTGKFTVDTTSMQVTHIERTVQNSVGKDQTVLGTAAVDYGPVVLNGKSFWLPTTIIAFTTETSKTNSVRFAARYNDYHRFAATATILPADK